MPTQQDPLAREASQTPRVGSYGGSYVPPPSYNVCYSNINFDQAAPLTASAVAQMWEMFGQAYGQPPSQPASDRWAVSFTQDNTATLVNSSYGVDTKAKAIEYATKDYKVSIKSTLKVINRHMDTLEKHRARLAKLEQLASELAASP